MLLLYFKLCDAMDCIQGCRKGTLCQRNRFAVSPHKLCRNAHQKAYKAPPRTISLSDDTRSRGSPREDVRFFVVAIWHHYRHGTWHYNSLPMGKSLGALCTDANIVSLSGPDLSVLKDVVALKDREILPLGIRNPREAPMSLKTALVSLLNVPAKQRQKKNHKHNKTGMKRRTFKKRRTVSAEETIL